jgi:hypothetical protein
MPLVRFTENIQRHVSCPPLEVTGGTLKDALDAYFATNPRARGYVLDDRGRLRQHMAIFIDGRQVRDRQSLGDAVDAGATIDLIQALSGG